MLSTRGAAALLERRLRVYGAIPEARAVADLARYTSSAENARRAVSLSLVRGRIIRRGDLLLPAPDWRAELHDATEAA